MPVYCYVCPKCGARKEEIRAIADREPQQPRDWCSACAPPLDHAHIPGTNVFVMQRDLTAERVGSPNQEWRTLYSESIGVHPKQVAEHRQRHPDIPLTDDGRVVINSLAEQKRITKKLGFHDRNSYS